MNREQQIIQFVDDMLIGLIVKRVEHEVPKAYTYYCECCDTEAETEEEIDHHSFCEIAAWNALKKELNART